jgi:putative transposase
VTWAIVEKGYSQRRACGLVEMGPKTYRYASRRGDDAGVQARLHELANARRGHVNGGVAKCGGGLGMTSNSYRRHRFPPDIIERRKRGSRATSQR